MTPLILRGRRPLFAVAAATCVVAGTMGALGAGAAVRPAPAGSGTAGFAGTPLTGSVTAGPSARQRYATLLFSRSEITAGDGCRPDDQGIARLDTTVAPFLASMRVSATGSLVTARTQQVTYKCTHNGDSLSASWTKATALARTFGWKFVSATSTYPHNLSHLTAAQARFQTCGSADTLEQHGLPGAQPPPTKIQATDGAECFAWGRVYGRSGATPASAGTKAPFWQHTRVLNGGPCDDRAAACSTIPARGSPRYANPSLFIAMIDALQPGQWLTLQAYILVTGKNPPYTHNRTRWNCTSRTRSCTGPTTWSGTATTTGSRS